MRCNHRLHDEVSQGKLYDGKNNPPLSQRWSSASYVTVLTSSASRKVCPKLQANANMRAACWRPCSAWASIIEWEMDENGGMLEGRGCSMTWKCCGILPLLFLSLSRSHLLFSPPYVSQSVRCSLAVRSSQPSVEASKGRRSYCHTHTHTHTDTRNLTAHTNSSAHSL